MSQPDFTDISVVLDRSGSMESVRSDTIGGFNTFLKEQQACPGRANLSLIQFDDHYEVVHASKTIGEVPALTSQTFVPRGSTALLDAIGRTINDTGARLSAMDEESRPGKVVVVILTDGHENSSHEFTKAKINEMITRQREAYAWEFVFLGANQDAIAVGQGMGFVGANAMTYAPNAAGTEAAFVATSANLRSYRTGTSTTTGYSDADREAQKRAGVKS
jgi:Mg-chelatase subunit ChlD